MFSFAVFKISDATIDQLPLSHIDFQDWFARFPPEIPPPPSLLPEMKPPHNVAQIKALEMDASEGL